MAIKVISSSTPTTELEAINTMLSGIGEAPVNSLSEVTNEVSMARNILQEVSREVQLEGWNWNTEDNYPLTPDIHGNITLNSSIIRVHFREPTDAEVTVRGTKVYDRVNHTYTFNSKAILYCTITWMLDFIDLPEAAKRYICIKALRIFQERVLGSQVLSQFQRDDEAKSRVQMLGEERKQARPNILTATYPPTGTWRIQDMANNRKFNRYD